VADKPVILLAFANDQEGQRYLRNLPEELRQLQAIIEAAARRGLCELVVRPNATLDQILDVFTTYRDRVAIFHYAGHAGPDELLLEARYPSGAAIHSEGLAAFLGQRRGLELVFLNACSTRAQVARLLAANVSAVIATARDIDDSMARDFAVAFYTELTSGGGLRAAYEVARARIRAAYGTESRPIARDMIHVAASNAAAEASGDGSFPWEMQVHPGAELAERWNLPDAAGNPLFGLPEPKVSWLPPAPFRHLQRFTREEAPLFLGRGHAIRDLYGLVVAPGLAPLILYHGQTGVGKSSLLDAGLLPRLESEYDVLYLRRDQALGLLATTCQGLGAAADTEPQPADLGRLWLGREQCADHRPVVLILDQAEEAYTRSRPGPRPAADPTGPTADSPPPLVAGQAEVANLIDALRLTFANTAQRPRGRMILSFRTEWLAAFEQACQQAHLWFVSVALGPLDGAGVTEAVEGPSRVPLLQLQYRLSVETGLGKIIADNLLADAGSAVAPTLQVLLTQMWEQAHAADPRSPRFDRTRYETLRKQGVLLGDFLDQQLAALEREHGEPVRSGLVLDLLEYHTTALGTAEQCHRESLELRYAHRRELLPELLGSCTSRYLLVEGTGPGSSTRLAHDTLGSLVQERFKTSLRPGQRARRILENRATDWKDGQVGAVLDRADLSTVERGLSGMRAPTADELRLLDASRMAEQRRRDEDAEHQWRLHEAVEQRKQAEIQAHAETERRLEEQRAANRALRRRTYVLRALLAAALFLTVVATYEWRMARTRQFEAERHSARLALDQGLSLCQQGESHRGMLWLARSLRIAPAEATDLRDYIRLNLTAWGHPFHRLLRSVQHASPDAGESSPLLAIVAFSPDGTRLATACGHTTRLWNTATAQPIGEPLSHKIFVRAVAFSPDGRRLATASDDATARLWDTATGQPIGRELSHHKSVRVVAFSPDGTRLVTGCLDQTAQLWDTATQETAGPSLRHEGQVQAVAFSPDGRRLVTAGGRAAHLWDGAGASAVGKPLWHTNSIRAVAFSPDGRRVATASDDRTAQLWDVESASPIGPPMKHNDPVVAVAFSPDGGRLATASVDATVKLWDTSTAQPIGLPLRHQGWVNALAFSPDGLRLATAGENATARLWDAVTLDPIGPPLQHQESKGVTAVAFSPDGKLLATASKDSTIRLWDATTPRLMGTSLSQLGFAQSVMFSPDGKLLATAGDDKKARLWDVATAQPVGTPLRHEDKVHALAFSPDGKSLATAGDDRKARLWDVATTQLVGTPLPHENKVYALAFSPDGKLLATGCDDETAQLWETATQKRAGPPLKHRGWVRAVAFSRDGEHLAAAGGTTVQIWDTKSAQTVGPPLQHEGYVHAVAFSPDSKLLVTNSDKLVRLWKVVRADRWFQRSSPPTAITCEEVGPPLLHGETVAAVAFSPDGTLLATASGSTARLWHVSTGRPIGPPLQHSDWVAAVAFSPDGRRLVTAVRDAATRSWDVPAAVEGDEEQINLWTQVLTTMELNVNDVVHPLRGREWEVRQRELSKRGGPPSPFHHLARSDQTWHDCQATYSGDVGFWFAAGWHIERMLAASPQDGSLLTRRGLARAHLGRWAEADSDFAIAAERTDALECWYAHALLQLHFGNSAEYRTICAGALKRLDQVDDACKVRWLSLVCALEPDSSADRDLPVRLAESLVMRDPSDPTFLGVLGAALFRAGQLDEAVARLDPVVAIPDHFAALEAARANNSRPPVDDLLRRGLKPALDPHCAVFSRLYLAMAQKRLGHADVAMRLIKDAVRRMGQQSLLEPNKEIDSQFTWSQGLQLLLLRREAEELLKTEEVPKGHGSAPGRQPTSSRPGPEDHVRR
jgi:WD40 repeat protein